ncbi:MAG TPA: hypothetical protein VNH64_03315 [Parvularculaceae bacterium]|nr:hypothetical protein [Parvularculaceae bacterium]
MKNKRASIAGLLFLLAATCAGLVGSANEPAFAQKKGNEEQQPSKASQTVSPEVGKALTAAYDASQQTPPDWKGALAILDKLLTERGERMRPYEKAQTYSFRGNIKYNLNDIRGALADFQAALQTKALPEEQNNQLRYYIAQLYFSLEQYQTAINGLKEWIAQATAAGEKVDCNAYYLMGAAYTLITPANFRAALQPAEQSVACLSEPKKSNYDLLNSVYSELGENSKRAALLEKMINYWPNQKGYWTQLSSLYSIQGKDSDAFAVLEVAYRAGLLKSENEIITLVQYYSYFDNPYRGAKVLEQEMNAGVVKRNEKNLTLLSQLWSQAREHKRAIPVLEEASKLSTKGELSYRLGQVLLADEQYTASEKALREALKKGGMDDRKTGDAWLLLGTARFSQAGPNDDSILRRAREAFVKAANYKDSARQARQWIEYIDAIFATEKLQRKIECQQNADARRDQIQRLATQAQVCRLQGGANCDAMIAQLKELQDIQNKTNCDAPPPASSDAAPADSSGEQEDQPSGATSGAASTNEGAAAPAQQTPAPAQPQ